jgi:hypothetical protein
MTIKQILPSNYSKQIYYISKTRTRKNIATGKRGTYSQKKVKRGKTALVFLLSAILVSLYAVSKTLIPLDDSLCILDSLIDSQFIAPMIGSAVPVPVVFVIQGRSGSTSTWYVMGSLSGGRSENDELTGSNNEQNGFPRIFACCKRGGRRTELWASSGNHFDCTTLEPSLDSTGLPNIRQNIILRLFEKFVVHCWR